jgi:hypothetical protein
LHPIESPDIFLCIAVDKGVQLAIGDIVERPPVCADVMHGYGQADARFWVVIRNDDVVPLDLSVQALLSVRIRIGIRTKDADQRNKKELTHRKD